MQDVPLQVVRAEELSSDEKPKSDTAAFRISIWRFLCCTLPIVLSAIVSIISVHVCKNQGFRYGAGIAAVCAIGFYMLNFCLAVAMIIYYVIDMQCPFCTETETAKASRGTKAFNVVNIFNVFLAILLAVIVVCIVSLEQRKYDIGIP